MNTEDLVKAPFLAYYGAKKCKTLARILSVFKTTKYKHKRQKKNHYFCELFNDRTWMSVQFWFVSLCLCIAYLFVFIGEN